MRDDPSDCRRRPCCCCFGRDAGNARAARREKGANRSGDGADKKEASPATAASAAGAAGVLGIRGSSSSRSLRRGFVATVAALGLTSLCLSANAVLTLVSQKQTAPPCRPPSSSHPSRPATTAATTTTMATTTGTRTPKDASGGSRAASTAPRRRSPLEVLYDESTNGTDLGSWVRIRALRAYAAFPTDDDNEDNLELGTPSLAHDPETNRTVVGFRISHKSSGLVLKNLRYLLLCEMAEEEEADGAEEGGHPPSPSRWRCHDAGMENSYVPPECDARRWRDPAQRTSYRHLTIGPEDARLYFDAEGNLGATAVMRGCHPHTPYGNGTALYSVYSLRWKKSYGTWRVDGYPKLLDLRKSDLSPLGAAYPVVTKSWISIPKQRGSGHSSTGDLRFSVGWTSNMTRHVVYRVANRTDTLYAVIPAESDDDDDPNVDYFRADVDSYRISTNVVEFEGALLGMGHRTVVTPRQRRAHNRHLPPPPPAVTYEHYWYAFCPDPPYRAVARSDSMALAGTYHTRITYALGLAREGRDLYLSWSEYDRVPRLTRFSAEEVLAALRTPASRGLAYDDGAPGGGFARACSSAGVSGGRAPPAPE